MLRVRVCRCGRWCTAPAHSWRAPRATASIWTSCCGEWRTPPWPALSHTPSPSHARSPHSRTLLGTCSQAPPHLVCRRPAPPPPWGRYVDPNQGHAGFSPHRDRQPDGAPGRPSRAAPRPAPGPRHSFARSRPTFLHACGHLTPTGLVGSSPAVSSRAAAALPPSADSPATFRADGSPKYSTLWLPLTDAVPENSCLYVLPRCAQIPCASRATWSP
jgi:hypothetical protein